MSRFTPLSSSPSSSKNICLSSYDSSSAMSSSVLAAITMASAPSEAAISVWLRGCRARSRQAGHRGQGVCSPGRRHHALPVQRITHQDMTSLLNFILWNPDTTALHLGPFDVRWYGLCWLTGLAIAYFLVRWLYHDQRVKDEYFDPLLLYCFVGILMGARLGHCIFYEPHYFLSSWQHVIEMFLPIRFVDGAPIAHGGMLYSLTAYCRALRRARRMHTMPMMMNGTESSWPILNSMSCSKASCTSLVYSITKRNVKISVRQSPKKKPVPAHSLCFL